jgi:DNA-binding NtrC family response regulator
MVVDDEPGIRFGVRDYFEASGYDVAEAGTGTDAEAAHARDPFDAVILDFRLPDMDGTELLRRIRGVDPTTVVLMLTGHASIDIAVQSVKLGAEQFFVKPVDLPALAVVLDRALEDQRLRRRQTASRARRSRDHVDPFLGTSRAIRELKSEVEPLLEADCGVLLLGETGAGKGVLARYIHERGARAAEPFVDLNCAGLSRELLESELFGHEAGAFTGATHAKQGLFEIAHRGTVFLDEIGDLEAGIQPRLLKVLEEKRFRRLGDLKERQVDVRLVAATHQDLGQLVRAGRFRSDLYYRISTVPVRVPPLRERAEDVPALARHFVESFARDWGVADPGISEAALDLLKGYAWPGNVRELRNTVERALLLSNRRQVEARHLRPGSPEAAPADEVPLNLAELEQRAITRALELERGRVPEAARRLGISKSGLYLKLKQYGLAPAGVRPE